MVKRLKLNIIKGNKIMDIKERVFSSNIKLIENGLAIGFFGNASQRHNDSMYIKPSGIKLFSEKKDCIVRVNIKTGKFNGKYSPSTDSPTHVELYKKFPQIGGVVHTHSIYATAWAQSGKSIPCLGTTHADYWNGEIPITRDLTEDEINGKYEKETAKVIIERIKELNLDPLDCPGILVANHGPFAWGETVEDAVKHAELLEYIARIAWLALSINPNAEPISSALLNKHFSRKHGPDAYYGQDSD
jgi:L-ribulose-5-phosphate 4-epimerase